MDNKEANGRYEVIMRETNRILPQLFRKMIGSGGMSLDTDSMSLAEPRDRDHLEWLARITAGFVLEEQAVWEPQVNECLTKISKDTRRMGDLDRLLEQMREAAAKEDATVDELKELIGKYRDPLENHYDLQKEKRDKAKFMDELAASIMEKPKSANDLKE
jgi:hypothetical protein